MEHCLHSPLFPCASENSIQSRYGDMSWRRPWAASSNGFSLIQQGNSPLSYENRENFPVPMRREFHCNYLIHGVKSRSLAPFPQLNQRKFPVFFRLNRGNLSLERQVRFYWLAAGAGMVIVLTLRAPGHAGSGCGSDKAPDGFGDEALRPPVTVTADRMNSSIAFGRRAEDLVVPSRRWMLAKCENSLLQRQKAPKLRCDSGLYAHALRLPVNSQDAPRYDEPRYRATALSERLRHH
jgi:hypothetical protein